MTDETGDILRPSCHLRWSQQLNTFLMYWLHCNDCDCCNQKAYYSEKFFWHSL